MMFENSVVEMKSIPFPALYAPFYHYPEFQNAICNAWGFPGQNHSIVLTDHKNWMFTDATCSVIN